MRFKWYYKWHNLRCAKAVHWLIAATYILSFPLVLYNVPNVPTKTKAEGVTNPYWEWLTPNPTKNALTDMAFADSNTVWVVGMYGSVARGTKPSDQADFTAANVTWKQYNLDTNSHLRGMHAVDINHVWLVGESSTLYFFNGTSWVNQVDDSGEIINTSISLSGKDLNGISGSGADIWVVGTGGLILHYDGSTWETQSSGTDHNLCDISASSESNAVVMGTATGSGDNGAAPILQYNGSEWSSMPSPYGFNNSHPAACWEGTLNAEEYKYVGVYTSGINSIWISFWSQGGITIPEGQPGYIEPDSEFQYSDGAYIFQFDPGDDDSESTDDDWDLKAPIASNSAVKSGTIVAGVPDGKMLAVKRTGETSRILVTSDGWTTQTATEGTVYTAGDFDLSDASKIWWLAKNGGVNAPISGLISNSQPITNVSDICSFGDTVYGIGRKENENDLFRFDGNSWSYTTVATALKSLYAQTTNDVWAAGGNFIDKSTDGGISFPSENRISLSDWYAIHKIRGYNDQGGNSDRVWVGGTKPGIGISFYKTDNNGGSWEEAQPGAPYTSGTIVSLAVTSDTVWAIHDIEGTRTILRYKNGVWTSFGVAQANDILAIGDNVYVAAGTVIQKFNNETWGVMPNSNGETIKSLSGADTSHLYALREDGYISWYNGVDWSTFQYTAGDDLTIAHSSVDQYNNYYTYFAGTSTNGTVTTDDDKGIVAYHYRPAGSFATKIIATGPGQTFNEYSGVTGTLYRQRAGENLALSVYATDSTYSIDRTNTSRIAFWTSDPYDSHNGYVDLVNGQGTITINNPHLSGSGWSYNFSDTENSLQPTSQSIIVDPGLPTQLSLSSTASIVAGSPVAVTLRVKDKYNSSTWVDSNLNVNFTTSSTSGRFAPSDSGPWSSSLDIALPSGSHSNFSSTTFYYLDYKTGTPTISAQANGMIGANLAFSVQLGGISPASDLVVSPSSLKVGTAATVTVRLVDTTSQSNAAVNKVVSLFSSRGNKDSITPAQATTDSNGIATFSISSTIAGTTTLTARDVTDNIYLEQEPLVTFYPSEVKQIILGNGPQIIEAGTAFSLNITLKDNYNNLATNSRGQINFYSDDVKASLPDTYTMTKGDNGTHTFDISLKSAGQKSIYVNYQSNSTPIESKVNIEVTPSLVSPFISDIKSNKTRIKNQGGEQATITVTLKDDYGNAISSKAVELHSSRKEDKVSPFSTSSSEQGKAVFTFSAQSEGKANLTAIDRTDNIYLNDSLSIDVYQSSLLSDLQDKILSNPTIQNIARRVLRPVAEAAAAVGLIPLLFQGAAALPQAFHMAGYLLTLAAQWLGIRRKQKPWGTIFDALTGTPVDLAVVRLFDAETKQLVATRVTDLAGRFGFPVGPGSYIVTVSKPGYLFPVTRNVLSYLAKGMSYYVGEPITIREKTTNLSLTIPVEPKFSTLNIWGKMRLFARDLTEWMVIHSALVFLPLLAFGGVISFFSAYVNLGTRSLVIAYIYCFLLIFYLGQRFFRLRKLGRVVDTTSGKGVGETLVNVYDAEYGALRASATTDRLGHFALYVPAGTYYIHIKKADYNLPDKKHNRVLNANIYRGGFITLRTPGYLTYTIPIEKLED